MIHKEGNPGRPVIISTNCHASKISEYVFYHLQPITKQISSYVKDASYFISKLNAAETLPDSIRTVYSTRTVHSISKGIKTVKT